MAVRAFLCIELPNQGHCAFVFPDFLFFWQARSVSLAFVLAFASTSLALLTEAILKAPVFLFRNVLSYGGYWGSWGITYLLRLTQWRPSNGTGAFHLPFAASVIALLLKATIIVAVLVIAWRRRHLRGAAVMESIGYGWIVFFILSPGVSVQYLVWLAPIVLVISAPLYGWLVASSSLFAFFFYNSIAGEWPWYSANANVSRELSLGSAPWSLLPWATLITGIILIWKRAVEADQSLSVFSSQKHSTSRRGSPGVTLRRLVRRRRSRAHEPGFATIGGVGVNDAALGCFIDSGD
jgi:hypothetical protein